MCALRARQDGAATDSLHLRRRRQRLKRLSPARNLPPYILNGHHLNMQDAKPWKAISDVLTSEPMVAPGNTSEAK